MSQETKTLSGSSLHDEQLVRSDEITSKERERRIAESLARLDALGDDDIDLSDMPEVTDFSGAVRGRFYRPPEGQVMLPIDHDVLAWFRAVDENYLTAINAALREHMERHRTS
ncbi:MAG: BrnA antitoxin family protein [Chloroflexia bacterium]|nr:BrnA antitoxin family protein [Chloroflexia bacterium]